MTDQLKRATAHAHQSLEGFLIPVIKNTHTKQEYIRLLAMFYGFYKPVEDATDTFPVADFLPDYAQRRKAASILLDLQTAGEQNIPVICLAIPHINSTAAALGAMYVLEGSTLGGQHIAAMLQRNLHLDATGGLSFFTGYKHETGSKWKIFREVLASYCTDPVQYSTVAAVAGQTFEKMKAWAEQVYGSYGHF